MNRGFLIGAIVGATLTGTVAAVAQVYATVDTNGVLKGYIVQKNGRTVCKNPEAWLDFRGQGNFIVCP
ncbi:MAG: hypothetical protein KF874_12635 [Rhizobiaceae bacterium]|nr:hypothetical protein [Rhizobiaceae bacterium]